MERTIITLPETSAETLKERVTNLRTQLQTSQEGQQTIAALFPTADVSTGPNIVDFTDWTEWSKHW